MPLHIVYTGDPFSHMNLFTGSSWRGLNSKMFLQAAIRFKWPQEDYHRLNTWILRFGFSPAIFSSCAVWSSIWHASRVSDWRLGKEAGSLSRNVALVSDWRLGKETGRLSRILALCLKLTQKNQYYLASWNQCSGSGPRSAFVGSVCLDIYNYWQPLGL